VSRTLPRRRRAVALGVLVAFLLALPVVVLVGYVLRPELGGASSGQRQISPMLDVEARTRLTTYKRSCQQSSDCESPLGCVADGRVGSSYCADSQCVADPQCPEGLVCRSVATLGDGPLVRLCVPVGPRKARGEVRPHASPPERGVWARAPLRGQEWLVRAILSPRGGGKLPAGVFLRRCGSRARVSSFVRGSRVLARRAMHSLR
jgi:hypothetical protein